MYQQDPWLARHFEPDQKHAQSRVLVPIYGNKHAPKAFAELNNEIDNLYADSTGYQVILSPEPFNTVDEHAIAVHVIPQAKSSLTPKLLQDYRVGYVPANMALSWEWDCFDCTPVFFSARMAAATPAGSMQMNKGRLKWRTNKKGSRSVCLSLVVHPHGLNRLVQAAAAQQSETQHAEDLEHQRLVDAVNWLLMIDDE